MNKDLNKIFKLDNKRIANSIQSKLNGKINNLIKKKVFIKNTILTTIVIFGAAIFAWNLGILTR